MKPNTMKLCVPLLAAVALWGCKEEVAPEQKVPVAATVKAFSASASSVAPGDKVTLSWEVADAQGVSVSTQTGDEVALSGSSVPKGSVEVAVQETTVFILTARGEGGSDARAVSVAAQAPSEELFFAATPPEVAAGEPVTLVWNVPGAEKVTVSADGATVVEDGAPQGSQVIRPNASGDYTLTAGALTATAHVAVAPSIFAFSSAEPSAQPGGTVTLNWKVGGATEVELQQEGAGALTTVTDAAQISDGSFTAQVPAVLPERNGVITYTLVARGPEGERSQMLTVYAGADPLVAKFLVPEFVKEGLAYPVTWQTLEADRVEVSVDGVSRFVSSSIATATNWTVVMPAPQAMTTVTLTATNARGGKTVKTATVTPVGLPTLVSFTTNTASVQNGGDAATLTWEVTNGRHVRISEAGGRVLLDSTGAAVGQGTLDVFPNGPVTYVLEADNTVGDSVTAATVDVTCVNPAQLVFNPATAPAGAQVTVVSTTAVGAGAVHGLPVIEKNAPGAAFVDISQTGTSINYSGPDSTAKLVTLPQPFSTRIYGVPVTGEKLSISINGWFMFHTSTVSGPDTPTAFPTSNLEPLAIAPFWADLYDNATGEIYVQVDTVGNEQRLIVQWDKVEYDPVTGSEVTVQAQVYESGKIVFAYPELSNVGTPVASIGVVSATEKSAVYATSLPAEGDTFTLFGPVTLPATITAAPDPFVALVEVGGGTGMLAIDGGYPVIPAGEFSIEEVNYNPAAGQEEWLEIQNHTAQAIDLNGWTLDFGNGQTHVLDSSNGIVILPPNGRILMGQSLNAAEYLNGGPAVDYVYGTAFSMPDAAGSVSLGLAGAAYTTSAWTSAGTQGTASLFQPDPNLVFASGVTALTCASSGTYGTSGQVGTPGASNQLCFPWSLKPGTHAFESIRFTGQVITGMQSTSNNSIDSATKVLDLTALGGRGAKIGNTLYGTAAKPLYVCSNGWVSLATTTSTSSGNSTPSTSAPNSVLALMWDDLAGNAGTTADPSGVYWQQFDPDGTPASGDEYTLISFEHWKRWSSSVTSDLNFQLRIDEGTGSVEYVYGNLTASNTTYADGSDATIWFESADGKYALKVLVNQPLLQPNSSYRFEFLP